jgi:hypothetical protein
LYSLCIFIVFTRTIYNFAFGSGNFVLFPVIFGPYCIYWNMNHIWKKGSFYSTLTNWSILVHVIYLYIWITIFLIGSLNKSCIFIWTKNIFLPNLFYAAKIIIDLVNADTQTFSRPYQLTCIRCTGSCYRCTLQPCWS